MRGILTRLNPKNYCALPHGRVQPKAMFYAFTADALSVNR